jgi:hypothetical protein
VPARNGPSNDLATRTIVSTRTNYERRSGSTFIDVGPYYFINDHWITDRKVPANAKTWDESLMVKFRRLVQYVSAIPAWERYLAAPLIERVRFPIESAVLLDKCAPSIKPQFIAVSNDLHRLLMEGMPPDKEEPNE